MEYGTYVLYHGNCYDGFGAAFAFWLTLRDKATYIPVIYGQPMPEIPDGSTVYIVDFSYPRQVLKELSARSRMLVVLDHHKTAQADLDGLQGELTKDHIIKFDMNKSGAVMAWEFWIGEHVPQFILYLQDRDLWKFELPYSREVSCALRSYPMDFKVWFDLHTAHPEKLKDEGIACMRLTNQMVEAMCAHAFEIKLFDVLMPCANATVFFSEVGNRLLEIHDTQCSAYYMDRGDGRRQWGLRSRPDFDCSAVAKAYGGGGHKNASGFTSATNFMPLVGLLKPKS